MTDRSNRVGRGRAATAHAPVRTRSLTAFAAAAVAIALPVTGCGGKSHAPAPAPGGTSATSTGKLPQATTYTTLKGLGQDASDAMADGTVVHPKAAVPVSATAGGPAVAVLPSTQLGSPTWVPVVEMKPGWDRVLLPSRPNRSAGWIPTGKTGLDTARSPYQIAVDTSARRLTLTRSGHKLGTWTVAVGAAKTPTPVGRTFLLASLAPAKKTYSPLILPVGAHSETLDTFGGGPGTVAFHGWPSASVFGKAVTHGCVRVPADALKKLSEVPLGTPVVVTA
ncbi:L,D-transpeptidase [Actinoallomurus spadix]|uniref:L,D-TPase catalytic domain-containing protein n=1 Tax=Actinoallomurus spadix TaxID=79912 RepID=A0ABN0X5B6_9ACTN|nr:L,D-transpeptidase [Actinoallomurus spadix]MCO5986806.1 L,D-transpeptidase [Actinoallomurus spadix]